MESDPKLIKNIKPIKLFRKWLDENKQKFVCKPYFFYKKKGRKNYLYLRYENIINNIEINISQNCWIETHALNLKNIIAKNFNKDFSDCTDLTIGFGVILKVDKDGKYYNQLHSKPVLHNSIEEVYYEEFNASFLKWSNHKIREENFLFLSWDEDWGIEYEHIINPETDGKRYESLRSTIKDNEILLSLSKKNISHFIKVLKK